MGNVFFYQSPTGAEFDLTWFCTACYIQENDISGFGRDIPIGVVIPITTTSPCNEDPLTSHFYIVKLGLTGVYRGIHFFLFLLQNIDCGYSLEPPH